MLEDIEMALTLKQIKNQQQLTIPNTIAKN